MLTTPFIRHNLPQARRAEDERVAISTIAIVANGKINCPRGWRTAVTPIGPSAADSPINASVRLPIAKPAITRPRVKLSPTFVIAALRVSLLGAMGASPTDPVAD
jgi:hypothetical protein